MASVWTHGVWTVAPGREEDFVAHWRALSERVAAELGTVELPTLLRDRDRPGEFVSFGRWPDVDEVNRFRSSEAFEEGLARLEDVLESLVTRTLDEVHHG